MYLTRQAQPEFQTQIDALPAGALLRESWRAISIIPGIINSERQALGLSTESIELADRRPIDDPIQRAIAAGGRSLDLATDLLDIAVAQDKARDSTP